jgi:AraC family transcriptional regulator
VKIPHDLIYLSGWHLYPTSFYHLLVAALASYRRLSRQHKGNVKNRIRRKKNGKMVNLKTSQFFGNTHENIHLDGITLTDTEYTHDKVDWHYHENAYFTFILEGSVLEGNKKGIYRCSAGSLLFHNWQDPHYNIKPPGFTRGFHIELEQSWLESYGINTDSVQGSINLLNPDLKILMYQIYKEAKTDGKSSYVAVHSLLIETFTRMAYLQVDSHRKTPLWVYKLREMLNDNWSENWTLQALAQSLEIHPIHLSRDFSKYFRYNMGEYIRILKVQRALSLLANKKLSLTDIALECGFSDQSHFIRCFKAVNKIRPSHYRDLLLK